MLYLDPDTARLEALRYIVSYPGFFPDGGSSPDKLLFYRGYSSVSGMQVAGHYDGLSWRDGATVSTTLK
ncbi:MAG: hypothetical protein AAFV53_28350 [Myxococcota bacterium]